MTTDLEFAKSYLNQLIKEGILDEKNIEGMTDEELMQTSTDFELWMDCRIENAIEGSYENRGR